MEDETFWKAFTFFKRGQVSLVRSDGGHLEFAVGPRKHPVYRTSRGVWSCGAVSDDGSWGCVFNAGVECSHVKACKLWLGRILEEV